MIRKSTIITLGIVAAFGLGEAEGATSLTQEQGVATLKVQTERLRSMMDKVSGRMSQFTATRKVTNAAAAVNREGGPKRLSEQAKTIKPTTTKTFGWYGSRWLPEDTYSYVYDADGNVLVETDVDAEGGYSRTVSEYNADGMVSFQETTVSSDGVDFDNNRKSEFEYDPILTNVITKRSEWIWLGGEWKLAGNNYKRIIARDEEGKVTSVTIAVLYDGIYDPTQRLTITYGENGEAIEIAEEILDYDGKEYFWEEGAKVTDIVWERTNGQLVDTEDIFSGANRVKSCSMQEPDGIVMNVEVEYAEDSDAYTGKITMTVDGMTVNGTVSYTPLENGGAIIEQEIFYMGMALYNTAEELRYDDWGLMTLYCVSASAYGETYREGQSGEVEYDAEGRPAVYTISEFYTDEDTGEEESEYIIRAEYSDYVNVTTDVRAVLPCETAEKCYDLNGMQVSKPEKGRIVIRDGKKIKY